METPIDIDAVNDRCDLTQVQYQCRTVRTDAPRRESPAARGKAAVGTESRRLQPHPLSRDRFPRYIVQ